MRGVVGEAELGHEVRGPSRVLVGREAVGEDVVQLQQLLRVRDRQGVCSSDLGGGRREGR